MTRLVEHFGMVVLAMAGVAMGWSAWRAIAGVRRRSATCDGRPGSRSWWRLINPWAWFVVTRCGYDLSGTPACDGVRVCPECGARCGGGRGAGLYVWRLSGGGGWGGTRVRLVPVSILLAALGWACVEVRWLRRSQWERWTPTVGLFVMAEAAPNVVRDDLLEELSNREPTMWGYERAWLRRIAIHAIGDDQRTYNGEWGMGVLEADVGSRESLEAALSDPDRQRRQIAGMILISRWAGDDRPSPALIRVAVEGLEDDRICSVGSGYFRNADDFSDWLLNHVEVSQDELAGALGSDDVQQRVVSAAILAIGRCPPHVDEAVRVLCVHLGENSIGDDALIAMNALWRCGPAAIPEVERYLDGQQGAEGDEQGRASAELVLRKLRGEPLAESELARLNIVTSSRFDPTEAREWDRGVAMPWIGR